VCSFFPLQLFARSSFSYWFFLYLSRQFVMGPLMMRTCAVWLFSTDLFSWACVTVMDVKLWIINYLYYNLLRFQIILSSDGLVVVHAIVMNIFHFPNKYICPHVLTAIYLSFILSLLFMFPWNPASLAYIHFQSPCLYYEVSVIEFLLSFLLIPTLWRQVSLNVVFMPGLFVSS
jgi:hypothetical protein